VLTKMDLPDAQERWEIVHKRAEEAGLTAMAISSSTHDGTQELMNVTAERLRELRQEDAERKIAEAALAPASGPVLRPEPEDAFTIVPEPDGYRVRGKRIERMAAMTNPESEEGMERLEKQLRKLGVLEALEQSGVEPGDVIHFGKMELVWGEEMW
jgi:GTP-binding protein